MTLKIFWESVQNAVSYNLYYSLSSGVTIANGTLISQITDIVYYHNNLTSNTRYYYIVAAVDAAGNIGAPSSEFSALTAG